MPSREVVASHRHKILLGTTSIIDPILFMEVNGQPVSGSYVLQRDEGSVRIIFPTHDSGKIYLMAVGQVFEADLPQISVNVKVFVAE